MSVDVSELYRLHRAKLVRLAVLLVDSVENAEDVVNEAFVGLYRKRETVADGTAAVAYVRRSVLNGCRDELRRRRLVRLRPYPAAVPGPGADEMTLLRDEHRETLAALRRLPTRDRQVLALRYWMDLSDRDIAEALNVSLGTVKSTASRALDKLELVLQEHL